MEKQKLKEIVVALIEIREEGKLKFSDDILIDVAVRIYNSESINDEKTTKTKLTDKQLAFLKSLQEQGQLPETIDIANLTKTEATTLIKETLNKGF